MKTTKKILSLLLVVTMIFTLAIPAFAAEEVPETLVSWVGGTSVTSNGANDVVKDVALTMNDSNPNGSPNLNQYGSLGVTTSTYGNLQVQPWYGTNNFSETNYGYMQFALSTKGYENLTVTMKAGNNGKAPASYAVSVSVDDGATWVAAADKLSAPDTKVNNEASAIVSTATLPEAAENQNSVLVRIQQAAAAINANNAGNLYVYGLSVEGTGVNDVVPAGELEGKTVILHSNDVHGAIAGYANMAALKADFEAKGADVILVDAGDFSQGTTYVSTSKGADAIAMMNAVGYDFATLGNHEFDYGWEQLKANIADANFKVLCADVLENGETIFDGHAIVEKDGVKIGFFGLETPEAQTKANPALIKGLTFLAGDEMFAAAQAEIDALKAAGADVIICLSHLGLDAESEPNRSVDMLAKVEGLDMIIDGHSHTVISKGIISTDKGDVEFPGAENIQSTGTAFANIGVIVIDNETKAIVDNYLVPVSEDSAKDETVAAAAQAIIDEINELYGEVFAKSEVELNGDKAPNGNRDSETNMGDLITDSMLWTVMHQDGAIRPGVGGVVAITNGGGIRAWMHKGDITMNDVHTVLPFGNTVAVVYVTGAELLEALEASTYCTPVSVGGFPQVAGIDFTIATCAKYDKNAETYPDSTYYGPASINRVTINSINGNDFDPEATYAVVTNNFCAAGGDTYYAFAAATEQFDTGIPMDEALMAYITEELDGVVGEKYAEPQGRIEVLEHQWSDWTTVIPCCVPDGGFESRECLVCGEIEVNELPENLNDHSGDPFTDISANHYHDYIIAANYLHIVNGYDDGTFKPNNNVTRAQFITMLWRMAGEDEAENTVLSFADADSIPDAFKAAVAWGVENGIIKGYEDNTFRANVAISRAQMATFMYRYLVMELGPSDAAVEASFGFVDEASFASSYVTAINVMANIGVMQGYDNAPTFKPNAVATRGMAATVLYRVMAVLYGAADEVA